MTPSIFLATTDIEKFERYPKLNVTENNIGAKHLLAREVNSVTWKKRQISIKVAQKWFHK